MSTELFAEMKVRYVITVLISGYPLSVQRSAVSQTLSWSATRELCCFPAPFVVLTFAFYDNAKQW